jgi:hypothetical protein
MRLPTARVRRELTVVDAISRAHAMGPAVSCLEDKPKEWDVPGKYRCKKCKATSDKKRKICKPVKVDKKK